MIRIKNQKEFSDYVDLAKKNPEKYWSLVAESFHWKKMWDQVRNGDFNNLNIEWFKGAELNITENCLDRHIQTLANKSAIIFEPNDPNEENISYTFSQLLAKVCQSANLLKDLGVKKGDVVCFYMGMTPELLINVLACARIGAIHSVVFGGFSAKALAERINDSQAVVLFTDDESRRGNKTVPLKEIADEALDNCPSIQKVLVHKWTNAKINWNPDRDLDYKLLVRDQPTKHRAEVMQAEDPLFILYTSGSTGKPKGLLHSCAGYMVYAQYSFENVFQPDLNSLFWCTADIGWITGHTYMAYGPLLAGTTQVLFEGVPTWPDAGRFWQTVDKLKVTHFYTAPTAIRALEACDHKFVEQANLSSLRVLGSVGEPINEEAWIWYNEKVGHKNCPIVDTWWQTETGGIMISPLANISTTIPSYALSPLPGIEIGLMNEKGEEILENDVEGNLVIKSPWPSVARTIFGDKERYKQTYFSTYPGCYFTGDGAKRNHAGQIRIIGRVDDVINVSGHRIGTAEVENALNLHPIVVESAVVGYPHDIKGQGIYAYVICTSSIQDTAILKKDLLELVATQIGPFAKPDKIQVVQGLPKTRSGKIMRRILRKIAAGEKSQFGDTSTLLNPEIVEQIQHGKTL